MKKDFCVEFVDQCGGVFITHPSIKSAKQHLAELPQIPNAQQNLKQLGVEVLNIVVKLDSSVGVCVGRVELNPKLAIKLDDTWRDRLACGAGFGVGLMDTKEATLYHASTSALARNDRIKNAKAQNVICKKVDRIKTTAKDSRIFAMILGAFKAVARAHTWLYVTADTAVESTKSAQKPNPPARNY